MDPEIKDKIIWPAAVSMGATVVYDLIKMIWPQITSKTLSVILYLAFLFGIFLFARYVLQLKRELYEVKRDLQKQIGSLAQECENKWFDNRAQKQIKRISV